MSTTVHPFRCRPFTTFALPLLALALLLAQQTASLHTFVPPFFIASLTPSPPKPAPVRAVGASCRPNDTALFSASNTPCLPLTDLSKRHAIFYLRTPRTTYLYCAIAKTGTTYHQALMHRQRGLFAYHHIPTIHNATSKHALFLPQPTSPVARSTLAHLLTSPTVPRYVVVRNPLTRLLSAYRDKVEREPRDRAAAFAAWVRSEFGEVAPKRRIWRGRNVHWKPQTLHCGYDGLRDLPRHFAHLRFERPGEVIAYLRGVVPGAAWAGGWGAEGESFGAFIRGARRRSGRTEDVFFDYFRSTDVFDAVMRAYRRDVAELGYAGDVAELRRRLVSVIEGTNHSVAHAWIGDRAWPELGKAR